MTSPPDINPNIRIHGNDYERYSITTKSVGEFKTKSAEELEKENWEVQDKRKTWEVCEGVDKRTMKEGRDEGVKRKLVGLGEANEVARRLAGKMGGVERSGNEEGSESGGDEGGRYDKCGNRCGNRYARQGGSAKSDVVGEWMGEGGL